MPKKRLNIILILVVLGLWGTVAYKSLNRFFPSENIALDADNVGQNFNIKKIEKDTFSLQKLSRDPFLSKAIVERTEPIISKSIISRPKAVVKPRPLVSKPIIEWPQVNYYGYIKSHQKTEELILVKIDNKLVKVRKNQNIDGVMIKRIFRDSIEVVYNKENKFIYIK